MNMHRFFSTTPCCANDVSAAGIVHQVGLAGLVALFVMTAGPSFAAEEVSAGASKVQRQYYVQDIKTAVSQHIESVLDGQGVFRMNDEKTGEDLALKFVQVHDPVRQIGDDVYFACTDFHVQGEAGKLYDIDFWMRDSGGELQVFRTKIHKEPRWSLVYGWYKQPRYTFVDDEIKYLY